MEIGHPSATFRINANVRVMPWTVMLYDASNTTNTQEYCKVPAGANGGAIAGVTLDLFSEPNYFIAEGVDPTTVTGTTPAVYNLGGGKNGLALMQGGGTARCYAAAAINQGDQLVVADAYGRVENLASAGIGAGTDFFRVGFAQSKATAANDIVIVKLTCDASQA